MANRRTALLPLLLIMAAAVVVTAQLRVTTDMGGFLPHEADSAEGVLLEQVRQGPSARVLLLAIEGSEARSLAKLSARLAEAMRHSGRYLQVLNGELVPSSMEESIWYQYRYLLQPVALDADMLEQALQRRLEELRSPLGLYTRQTLAEDPTAAFRHLLQSWQGDSRAVLRHGVWFSEDGRALLLARTHAAGFDLDAQQQNLQQLRRQFGTLAGASDARLVISGAPAIAVASRETIRSESQLASAVASIMVALILLLVYRSWRLWLLSVLPLGGAVLVALATTTIVFGSVHGITVAFGITLLGVAIDYPIHLFSHLARESSPLESLRRIWPTMRLGVASTVIGFAALLLTRFDGLVQLGVFAISGLLAAATFTRYLLPALLPESWQGRVVEGERPVKQLSASWRWLPLPLLVAAAAAVALSDRPLWEDDLTALSPVPEAVRLEDRALRAALPASELSHLLLMEADDVESLLQAQEELRPQLQHWQEQGVISGYQLAADRLPSKILQRERQAKLPSAEELKQLLRQAASKTPFRAEAFEPFIDAVSASRSLQPLVLADVTDTAMGLPLAGLLFERNGRWWGIVRLAGVTSTDELQQGVPRAVRYVDLRQVTQGMLERFRDEALYNLAWGLLAIVLLIAWRVRSTARVVAVMLPLVTAMALTLAVLYLLGERLTLFHLTSLLLVAGIGLDYGLFFSRPDKPSEQARTRHALRVCAISTMAVFAILSVSHLPVLRAIGLTVLLGVASAYLLARLSGASFAAAGGSGQTV